MLLKSCFDGIGTGAGVAWPLFGIIASALSLGVGGALAIILGSICCFLFLAVSIATFYISYKKFKQDSLLLKEQLYPCMFLFLDNLYQQFLKLPPKNGFTFKDFLQEWTLGKKYTHPLPVKFIQTLMTSSPSFVQAYGRLTLMEKELVGQKNIEKFIQHPEVEKMIPAPPLKDRLHHGFISSMGVFGSIIGCSAGVMGILTGLGIMSGFAAIPFLGPLIILAGIGLGTYVAVQSVKIANEKHVKTEICKCFNAYNGEEKTAEVNYHPSIQVTKSRAFFPRPAIRLESRSVPVLHSTHSTNEEERPAPRRRLSI